MSDLDYFKQAQHYYSHAPTIILGSGASAAFGLSSMGALATHLINNMDLNDCDKECEEKWKSFVHLLKSGKDLESALLEIRLPALLTEKIVNMTWGLLNPQDLDVFSRSIQNSNFFALSQLISSLFRSALKEVNIITTNYDRLAEYAVEYAGHHHYTGFSHGFYRQQKNSSYLNCQRVVNILKVHGSLDWFSSPLGDVIGYTQLHAIPEKHTPKIVTPGIEKYSTTYHEPFRSIIQMADKAINNAKSYLCIGFGFNDEHIQEKLVEKCVRENACITLITWGLSNSARKFLLEGNVSNYLAIERGEHDLQSIIYSSQSNEVVVVDEDYWSLNGYLKLVL